MKTSLVHYDYILKESAISFATCDQFYEGVFLPSKKEIILCSNVLYHKDEFDNALKR